VTAPKLALTDSDLVALAVDVVVIGTVQGPDGLELAPGSDAVAAAFDGGLPALLGVLGATGKAEEVVKAPTGDKLAAPLLIAVGLGKPASTASAATRCGARPARRRGP